MRIQLCLSALAFGVFVQAGACVEKPAIPQDRKQMEESRKQAREYFRKTYVEGYEKAGRRDAKWDDFARKALLARIEDRVSGSRSEAGADVQREVTQSAVKAIENGCDDPLILFLQFQRLERYTNENDSEYLTAWRARNVKAAEAIAEQIPESKYPPAVKAELLVKTALTLLLNDYTNPDARKAADERLDRSIKLLPDVVSDGSVAAFSDGAYLIAQMEIVRTMVRAPRKVLHDRIMAALNAAKSPAAFRDHTEGNFRTSYAWDARGAGVGSTVTENGATSFKDRLNAAKSALEKAHQAAPAWSLPAACMIDVCRGLGLDRDEMEQWFQKAMAADGDCFQACEAKRLYLMPMWHGDEQSVLEFARQCRDTKNWHAGLPFLLIQTRLKVPGALGFNLRALTKPEVWSDVSSVYEPLLKERPLAQAARCHYFRFAMAASQSDVALRLVADMQKQPIWRAAFKSEAEYKVLMADIDKMRQKGDPKPDGDPGR